MECRRGGILMSEPLIDARLGIKPTLPAVSWDYEGTVALSLIHI